MTNVEDRHAAHCWMANAIRVRINIQGGSTAAGRCPPLLRVCSQLVIDEATVESADAAKATVLQRGYFITLRLETKIRNTRKKTVMNSRVGGEVDDHAPNPTNIMQK